MSTSTASNRPRHDAPKVAPTFAPGARVLIRGEEWIVRGARRTVYGDTEVRVTGLSEIVRGKEFVFLTPALDEVTELDPESTALTQDESPGYRKTKLYLESLLRNSPPTEPRVYLGHRAAMNGAPYQLVPAAKALAQARPRILIADAVGLGKTIEAGILLSELIRRGRGRRILVVALKSVLEQLQQELWARFTIPLVRLDSDGLARVQRKLPANANPFYYFDRVIISIDTLKKDEKYRRFLEQCRWDVTLIDECQHVAMRAKSAAGRSQRARLAELLAGSCDALVLTSATPHDGKPESFASLINLLEPTAVADLQNYTREDVQGLYVRRFKKDVAHQTHEAFRPRVLVRHTVEANAAEDAVFEPLATAKFRTLQAHGAGEGVLFRATLLKGMLSSAQALAQTLDERISKLRKAPDKPGAAEDLATLSELAGVAQLAAKGGGSKLERLISLLRGMGVAPGVDERVVIFSERIRTLDLLLETLPKALDLPSDAVACFHGSLDDRKQQALVKEFGTETGKVRVLLCSDAAAEGINLHFYCHRLVHFDIPWSLITLEQRNGRIDRFGQQHAPEIHYLLQKPGIEQLRGDLQILDLLVDKEAEAADVLGDVRWLMNLHDAEAEEERIARAISQHERAEDVLPDLDELDLDELLASSTGLEASGVEVQAETAEAHSLYASELAYWRDAAAELERVGALSHKPEWHDEIEGVSWPLSEDLVRRFEYLPPELRRESEGVLKLSADRGVVQRALADARKDSARFPQWQYLWPLHPVAGWIEDRLLAGYARHEAPVLKQLALDPDECIFLMEGVLSNQASQPVVVDWFGVRFVDSAAPSVVAFPFAALQGQHGTLSNDGGRIDLARAEALRASAVHAARVHMAELRARRARELKPQLKHEHQRLQAWQAQRLAQLQDVHDHAEAAGRSLRRDEQERLQRQRAEVQRRMEDRRRWVEERLSTVEAAYVRIAAVLVGASFAASKRGRA